MVILSKEYIIEIFNTGYRRGHEDTVECCYTDVHYSDVQTYHKEDVEELLQDMSIIYDDISGI